MKMLDMMKQMHEVRKIQKALAAKTVEISSNDKMVTIVARGDMTIASVKLHPDVFQMKPEKLERILTSTINGALDSSKKAAAADMQKLTGGLGGLSEMLGGG
ncbi:MAG: YbaB/EbfC family nucleoid-associated protein [Lentisphaerae bacterium]|nr:YbaB/EbfC family nucleoid-associated protein [Lentisphaerota bacterium]